MIFYNIYVSLSQEWERHEVLLSKYIHFSILAHYFFNIMQGSLIWPQVRNRSLLRNCLCNCLVTSYYSLLTWLKFYVFMTWPYLEFTIFAPIKPSSVRFNRWTQIHKSRSEIIPILIPIHPSKCIHNLTRPPWLPETSERRSGDR